MNSIYRRLFIGLFVIFGLAVAPLSFAGHYGYNVNVYGPGYSVGYGGCHHCSGYYGGHTSVGVYGPAYYGPAYYTAPYPYVVYGRPAHRVYHEHGYNRDYRHDRHRRHHHDRW